MAFIEFKEGISTGLCQSCQRPLQTLTPIDSEFPSRLQDSESSDGHVHLEKVISDLNNATKAAFPKQTMHYGNVYVLLLRWEADDLGTATEIKDLEGVFRNMYHYRTESWQIPSEKSYTSLNQKVLDFQKDKGEGDLLILYYAGHGIGDLRSNESIWAA